MSRRRLNGAFAHSWETVGTLSGEQVTDLSCTSPHCISHKRRIAETWDPVWGTGNNAFQVPIMDFNKFIGIAHTDDEAAVGADLSRPPPIYRPKRGPKLLGLFCETALSASILIHEFPECTPKKCHFSLPLCRSTTQAVPNCHAF